MGTRKKLKCSAAAKMNKKTMKDSCLTYEDATKIKNKWNSRSGENRKIDYLPGNDIISRLYEYNQKCIDDMCVINHVYSDDKNNDELTELKERFAPFAPETWKKNPNTWLTSSDIRNVLNQYEKVYDNFEFIGPSAIDWYNKRDDKSDFVCNRLNELNVSNMKDKTGIVFNLDEHNKGGSHWVAMYVNNADPVNKYFYFFDSQGYRCPVRIKKLFHKCKEHCNFYNPSGDKVKTHFISNENYVHQKQDTECGVYCIYFIIHMIQNGDYSVFRDKKKLVRDKVMQRYRKKYFN